MEKTFDFEQVGKRMPYDVPNDFFDKFEENMMVEVKSRRSKKPLRIALSSILAVAAAIALFFVMQPLLPKSNVDDFESVELAFNNLSTDDQDFLIQVYEDEDILMNDFEFNP
jgi:hypothetical protein